MTSFATNELGKHPCKEGLHGVVRESTTKRKKACSGLMENISKIMR